MEFIPYSGSFLNDIVNGLMASFFGQLYKPFIFTFYCWVIRLFGGDTVLYKFFFSSLYLITGIIIYAFLRRLTGKPSLSTWATFISLLTVPFLQQVFMSFYTNIFGVIFIFLLSMLFITERGDVWWYAGVIILSVINAFVTDDTRLFTIPFLLSIALVRGFSRKRCFVLFLTLLFLTFSNFFFLKLLGGKTLMPVPPEGIFWSYFYYSGFVADYFIYAFGFSGIILASIRPVLFLKKGYVIILFLLLGSGIILFQRQYPYSNQWHNFFFVTPSLPHQFFLFYILILLALLLLCIKRGEAYYRVFALEIFIISSVLIFVTGIFPRVRTDPSSRHLLCLYPFLAFLILESGVELWRKGGLSRAITAFLFISLTFHLIANAFNSSTREEAVSRVFKEGRDYLRNHVFRFAPGCLYVVGPNYFLPEIRDFVNPSGRNIQVFSLPSCAMTDLETFSLFSELLAKECKWKRRILLSMRFMPESSPLYEFPSGRFFEGLLKTQSRLADQVSMAYYAYMHYGELPVERVLKGFPLRNKIDERFYLLPFFVSELVHRLRFKIPLLLPYRVTVEIRELK